MARYDDIIEGYQEMQGELRRRIARLRAGGMKGRSAGVLDAAVQQSQREIVELDGAIARCREKTRRW